MPDTMPNDFHYNFAEEEIIVDKFSKIVELLYE